VSIVAAFICVIFIIDLCNGASVNLGKAWIVGTVMALIVMYKLAVFRVARDGVMTFCRSLAVPQFEEFMFSYSWSREDTNIRTLARGVWNAGAGVWIDVVKLTGGDDIGSVVRTMVNKVRYCVVFLSRPYLDSGNCIIELTEALAHPKKCIFCVLDPEDKELREGGAVSNYIKALKPYKWCTGLLELMPILDDEIQNVDDRAAYVWWSKQKISGAGIPESVVPKGWPIPMFSLGGRRVTPDGSLHVGPIYISGDLKEQGECIRLPWLFLLTIGGIVVAFFNIYLKYNDTTNPRDNIDYAALGLIAACNFAPLFSFWRLFETRTELEPSLRPLLATRALKGFGDKGMRVSVIGNPTDKMHQNLTAFLDRIGHLETSPTTVDGKPAVTDMTKMKDLTTEKPKGICIYVMNDDKARDLVFKFDSKPPFDERFSVFLWSNDDSGIAFQGGTNLSRYLVIIAPVMLTTTAQEVFCTVGSKIVDYIHNERHLVWPPGVNIKVQ